ncbi:MAG UNVERIFIED_CONTAM: hypothetical protein LVQ98_01065 [Rickettsiaceae bacterium]|jgi:hypothetical protein
MSTAALRAPVLSKAQEFLGNVRPGNVAITIISSTRLRDPSADFTVRDIGELLSLLYTMPVIKKLTLDFPQGSDGYIEKGNAALAALAKCYSINELVVRNLAPEHHEALAKLLKSTVSIVSLTLFECQDGSEALWEAIRHNNTLVEIKYYTENKDSPVNQFIQAVKANPNIAYSDLRYNHRGVEDLGYALTGSCAVNAECFKYPFKKLLPNAAEGVFPSLMHLMPEINSLLRAGITHEAIAKGILSENPSCWKTKEQFFPKMVQLFIQHFKAVCTSGSEEALGEAAQAMINFVKCNPMHAMPIATVFIEENCLPVLETILQIPGAELDYKLLFAQLKISEVASAKYEFNDYGDVVIFEASEEEIMYSNICRRVLANIKDFHQNPEHLQNDTTSPIPMKVAIAMVIMERLKYHILSDEYLSAIKRNFHSKYAENKLLDTIAAKIEKNKISFEEFLINIILTDALLEDCPLTLVANFTPAEIISKFGTDFLKYYSHHDFPAFVGVKDIVTTTLGADDDAAAAEGTS